MNALNTTGEALLDDRPSGSDGADQMGHLVTGELDLSHGVALYLDDITVSFDGFRALNKLNLTIDAGELRCIIGPNGAGKTTMMDVITGKTRPDSGSAFFGQTMDLTRFTEPEIAHAAARLHMGQQGGHIQPAGVDDGAGVVLHGHHLGTGFGKQLACGAAQIPA